MGLRLHRLFRLDRWLRLHLDDCLGCWRLVFLSMRLLFRLVSLFCRHCLLRLALFRYLPFVRLVVDRNHLFVVLLLPLLALLPYSCLGMWLILFLVCFLGLYWYLVFLPMCRLCHLVSHLYWYFLLHLGHCRV